MHSTPYESRMNVPALRTLLSACELNKSRLEYEDASFVCLKLSELSVSFTKFDFGEVGQFDCNELSAESGDLITDTTEELDQTLHASYLGGVEEQTTSLLRDLEEKVQQQMDHREETVQEEVRWERVQEEEQQQLKVAVDSMQRNHDQEMKELQAVVNRLMKENAQLKNSLNNVNISRGRGNLNEYSSESTDHREPTKQTNDRNEQRSSSIGLSNKMFTPKNNTPTLNKPRQPLQRLQFTWPADEDLTVDTSYSESISDGSASFVEAIGDLRRSPEVLGGSEDFAEAMGDIHRPTEAKMSPRVLQRLTCTGKRLLSVSSKLEDTSFSENDDPIYKLALAGDAGSGKSSFLLRLSTHRFKKDPQSTVGIDCKVKKMVVDGKPTTLQIWDTAGQERFRSLTRSYFRNVHGIFLLYDITCKSSFLNIRQWMDQIEESVESPVPMCIVGNKADLRSELPEGSCVSTAQGERLAMVYNTLFCETSAKEGTNVVEAVLHLAREVKKSTQSTLPVGEEVRPLNSCCWM